MLDAKLYLQDIADVRNAARTLNGLIQRGVLAADWQPEANRLENLAAAIHAHYTEQYQAEVKAAGGCRGCEQPKGVDATTSPDM